jgi:phosphatidylserine/phosphatidylglycerophosphate/cardiolipin synthase-like enzyme
VEIEWLYVDMIMSAKKLVYAESQYFASRAVAQAIAKRLAEPNGPEFVMINPVKSDNWLGAIAMDTARPRLRESIRRHDPYDRFRIYHPVTAKGEPIYVHSKLMIIDEELMRVGSSNFNNRSMRFDNECDVAFEADGSELTRSKLRDLRNSLLGERLGVAQTRCWMPLSGTVRSLPRWRLFGDHQLMQKLVRNELCLSTKRLRLATSRHGWPTTKSWTPKGLRKYSSPSRSGGCFADASSCP